MRIDASSNVLFKTHTKHPRKSPSSSFSTMPEHIPPCTECGKRFSSQKALYGHMRCHPERQWRGINPPPNFRRPVSLARPPSCSEIQMTPEDHEVALCLLMLANGFGLIQGLPSPETPEPEGLAFAPGHPSLSSNIFECSSCKKVFGSHQALGGHRASHKNVKGCFAITKSGDSDVVDDQNNQNAFNVDGGGDGHKCSICWKVFSSGQALGGHKRCHWEKGEGENGNLNLLIPPNGFNSNEGEEGCGLDLNLPVGPAREQEYSSSSYNASSSSALTLDLRLGL